MPCFLSLFFSITITQYLNVLLHIIWTRFHTHASAHEYMQHTMQSRNENYWLLLLVLFTIFFYIIVVVYFILYFFFIVFNYFPLALHFSVCICIHCVTFKSQTTVGADCSKLHIVLPNRCWNIIESIFLRCIRIWDKIKKQQRAQRRNISRRGTRTTATKIKKKKTKKQMPAIQIERNENGNNTISFCLFLYACHERLSLRHHRSMRRTRACGLYMELCVLWLWCMCVCASLIVCTY